MNQNSRPQTVGPVYFCLNHLERLGAGWLTDWVCSDLQPSRWEGELLPNEDAALTAGSRATGRVLAQATVFLILILPAKGYFSSDRILLLRHLLLLLVLKINKF